MLTVDSRPLNPALANQSIAIPNHASRKILTPSFQPDGTLLFYFSWTKQQIAPTSQVDITIVKATGLSTAPDGASYAGLTRDAAGVAHHIFWIINPQ